MHVLLLMNFQLSSLTTLTVDRTLISADLLIVFRVRFLLFFFGVRTLVEKSERNDTVVRRSFHSRTTKLGSTLLLFNHLAFPSNYQVQLLSTFRHDNNNSCDRIAHCDVAGQLLLICNGISLFRSIRYHIGIVNARHLT